MSISRVSSVVVGGPYHHHPRQQTDDANSQTSGDQTQTQSASDSTNAVDTSNPAQNALLALLGSLAVSSSSQNGTDGSRDKKSVALHDAVTAYSQWS